MLTNLLLAVLVAGNVVASPIWFHQEKKCFTYKQCTPDLSTAYYTSTSKEWYNNNRDCRTHYTTRPTCSPISRCTTKTTATSCTTMEPNCCFCMKPCTYTTTKVVYHNYWHWGKCDTYMLTGTSYTVGKCCTTDVPPPTGTCTTVTSLVTYSTSSKERCFSLERYCCLFASAFPKVLCSAIYVWSYFALLGISEAALAVPKWLLRIASTLLLALGLGTYYLVVIHGPGSPLDFPEMRMASVDGDIPGPPAGLVANSHTVKLSGGFRYCTKCSVWKPDRTHHCSACRRCILRMDHHCPWFAVCIGHNNYRYFVQFLGYTVVYAFVAFSASAKFVYDFIFTETADGGRGYESEFINLNWVFLFVVSMAMAVALSVFTGLTIYQVLCNTTTIESYEFNNVRARDRSINPGKLNIFDLGWRANWRTTMGEGWMQWMFPLLNPETFVLDDDYDLGYLHSGLVFRVNRLTMVELERNVALQRELDIRLRAWGDQRKAQEAQALESEYGRA
ncbi:hypothetical protein BABINDRAFT_15649 [Babjeviella inositovora NRRL Y-12698]|uniref:Palmitoyltransferase n=1 Tax=Babjeviella inositovora NRRL Y-12698 TaxID=984486 RepID=A0A1E3QK91_9ASCO|nr:uncharacterized protein BABINDRAFT_15649 [Babjeviella inositovora NRRL Y-12698]ODQ77417.1 hypothetical protein BABINDRAFT_15649 [Babjeviella inositovora NRRL Y-12698]